MSAFTTSLRAVIKSLLPVIDSTDNESMSDVIGNKRDTSLSDLNAYPSVMGHLRAGYYHSHAPAKVYPTGDATHGASPVTITSGNAEAWIHGTITEVVPANTITVPFDIHWCLISEISATDDYELCLYKGAAASEELIGTIAFARSAVMSQEGDIPIQILPQAANTRISASLACGDGDGASCEIKLYYHEYPDIT